MKPKIIIISFIAMLFFSCNEEWLDIKPLSINTPENVYVDKGGMEALLLSLRKGLRNDFTGKWPSTLALQYMCTDFGVAGESTWGLVQNFDMFMTPTSIGVKEYFASWPDTWAAIRDANVLISRIDDPEWESDADKNAILAEGYFHRAYWYYNLINTYGDVPFLNNETKSPRTDFYSYSRKTILNKIESDMEFAVQWLPEVVAPGKINKAAGYQLLTKLYLANSKFDNAIVASSKIINNGKYSLMTDRFGDVADDSRLNVIWDLHQRENKSISNNKEAILVVQDKYGFSDASTKKGTMSQFQFSPWWSHSLFIKDPDGKRGCTDAKANAQIIALGRGVGQSRPSAYLAYDIWKDCGADLRHDPDTNWMPVNKIYYNNPASNYYGQPIDIKYNNPSDSVRGWFPWPHYKLYVKDELRPTKPRGGNSDWYAYRLAETFLLRAEAYVWKGEFGKAAEDINKVRERALAPPVKSSEINIGYILDERARELAYETPRKVELGRISFIMAENNLNGYSIDNFHEINFWFDRVIEKNTFYNRGISYDNNEYKMSPYHVLWPIPQSAIDANTTGHINQNLGYQGAETNIAPKTEITEEE